MMLLLSFGLGLLGMGGTLIFGGMLLFEVLGMAHDKATDGRVSDYGKRSTKGTLKLFLISFAVMAAGLLLSAAFGS